MSTSRTESIKWKPWLDIEEMFSCTLLEMDDNDIAG